VETPALFATSLMFMRSLAGLAAHEGLMPNFLCRSLPARQFVLQ
jgi:hypothetical protein